MNKNMEYRVEICRIAQAEDTMNEAAREGWRVIAVTPNIARGYGLTITFERALDNGTTI